MTDATKAAMPACPECGTPLQLNGVDESRSPPVAVFACPSCKVNFFAKVPS